VGENEGVEKIATIDILNKNTKCRRTITEGTLRLGKILGQESGGGGSGGGAEPDYSKSFLNSNNKTLLSIYHLV